MTPRVWKIILVVAFKAWCYCALSLAAPSLVLAQSSPPLPDDIRIEPPAGNLPPQIQAFSGAWEGEWRVTVPSWYFKDGRLKVILVVEKVWDQGATVVYARGECPEWLVRKGWGRYEGTISPNDGRLGLSFSDKGEGKHTFFINKRGNLEETSLMFGGVREIELTRMADLAHPKKPPEVPAGNLAQARATDRGKRGQKINESYWKEPDIKNLKPWKGPKPEVTFRGVDIRKQSGFVNRWVNNPDYLFNNGVEYLYLNQFDKAIAELNRVLQKNPRYGDAYFNRGLVYALQSKYDSAIADFNKYIELEKRDSEAFYNRGLAYSLLGQHVQALADLTKVLELTPKDAPTIYVRGFVHHQMGGRDQAKSDYQLAQQVDPGVNQFFIEQGELKTFALSMGGHPPKPPESRAEALHKKQALALARKGQYDEAITEFTKALEANPRDSEAHNSRGSTYTLKGQYEQALDDFTKALELNPKYAKAYYNRALANYYKGQYDQAIADLSKAIELSPKDAEAYNNRGLAYDQKRDYAKGIDDFNMAIALNAKLADAIFNKAVSCDKAGRGDEARKAYAAFVKLAPPEASAQVEQAKRSLERP